MSDFKLDKTTESRFEKFYGGYRDSNIKAIAHECLQNALDHGFDVSIKNDQIVALTDELGELCAALRNKDVDNELEEVVDILIRTFAYAEHHFKKLWVKALLQKMEYNRGRPHKHNKAF